MKILLVHPQSKSDAKTQQQLSQPLQKMGHEVILLEDPDSLIPTLNGFWPDALVMNFFCGDLTATDMCTEIFDLFGELPSVVIHSSENEHRFLANRFPQYGFLISPFTQDDLAGTLARVHCGSVSLTG